MTSTATPTFEAVPEAVEESAVAPRTASSTSTYSQILKSTALIGGASAIGVAVGIVRMKAMAILVGPSGIGLMSTLSSIADVTRSLAEMGINSSGVRQIAHAASSGDEQRVARTATVLRRTALALGLFGALLLLVFCRPIAIMTFGNADHAWTVAFLSLAVFFKLIADGQGALLQGMRRIDDIAKVGVLGALLGVFISVPLIYWLREGGVVWALVSVAMASTLVSWWYARKVRVSPPVLTGAQLREEVGALLKLGLAFMVSSLLVMGAAYAVRIILIRHGGLAEAGLYQSAWTIGGLYVGFVLQAMGADFYPRLVAVAADSCECNRIVNEQAHVSLLLAGVGVIATLAFAPLVLRLFYSAEFSAATDTLRWICLGMALRVISWPMGFIIIARGAQKAFMLTELAWAIVHVGLAWVLVDRFGPQGAGIAFFSSYVLHTLMIYLVVRRMTGFRWSKPTFRSGALIVSTISLSFCSFYVLPPGWAMSLSGAVILLGAWYSLKTLLALLAGDRLPRRLRDVLLRFRGAGSTTS